MRGGEEAKDNASNIKKSYISALFMWASVSGNILYFTYCIVHFIQYQYSVHCTICATHLFVPLWFYWNQILEQSMGARERVGIGYKGWRNRFLGSLKV
jgi:hypothetical protein